MSAPFEIITPNPYQVTQEDCDYAALGQNDVWMIAAPRDERLAKAMLYRIRTRALRALGPGEVKVRREGDWFRVSRKRAGFVPVVVIGKRAVRVTEVERQEMVRMEVKRDKIITLSDAGLRINDDNNVLSEADLRRLAGLIKARLMEDAKYPDVPYAAVRPGETIATTAPLQRSRVKTAATRVRMQAAREWGRENVVIEHRGGEFFVTRRDRKA